MDHDTGFSFDWRDEFNEIRSLHQDEVAQTIGQLISSKEFSQLIKERAGPNLFQKLLDELSAVVSIEAFQELIKEKLLPLIRNTYEDLVIEGLDKLAPDQAYIFISNHHDILMDPLLINLSLLENDFKSCHCAIGDNLTQSPLASILAGLNRCFKVMRSLTSPKAMLKAMRLQSEYINYLHFNQTAHIWIAQKEGRSKDNIDQTNPALIKMLMLAKPKDIPADLFLTMQNIVPVAISYEWDPCDLEKAEQLLAEASEDGYIRSQTDDQRAMEKGLIGPKGNITVRFGTPLRSTEETPLNRYEVANQIDKFIRENSQLYPCNYSAHSLLHDKPNEDYPVSGEELDQAKQNIQRRFDGVSESLKERILKSYAQVYENFYLEKPKN